MSNNDTAVKGEIGYFGLSEWWLSEFSPEERRSIIETYKPLTVSTGPSESNGESMLIDGDPSTGGVYGGPQIYGTAFTFLSNLVMWFSKEEYRTIKYRILQKAEGMIDDKTNILHLHDYLTARIIAYYRHRDTDPIALGEAIKACKRQIEIADQVIKAWDKEYGKEGRKAYREEYRKEYEKQYYGPPHKGYEQLAIIEEKLGHFDSAIELAKKANEQGWCGEWEDRIERCMKKKNKSKR